MECLIGFGLPSAFQFPNGFIAIAIDLKILLHQCIDYMNGQYLPYNQRRPSPIVAKTAMVESQMEIREDSQKLIELKNNKTIDSKDIADEQEKIELKRNYLYKQIAAYNELFGTAINEAQIAGLAALYTNTMNAIVKEAKENLATLQWMKSFVSTVGKVEVTNELVKVYGKKDKSELPDEIQFSKLSAQSKNYVWGKTTDALKNTVKARKEGVMSEEQAHENLAKIISENPVAYKDGVLKLMGINLDELDKTTTKETIKAYLKSNKRT